MDAVILAAGRGERLAGVMAPFHKPLMVVNGRPLIQQVVAHASTFVAGRIIVVVAPENALPITQVLNTMHVNGTEVVVVVQRLPLGPGASLRTGLRQCKAEDALVLLSDNVMSNGDVASVVRSRYDNVIGVRAIEPEGAERFTRIRTDNKWVEKIPIEDKDIHSDGMVRCWVGPIKVRAKEMEHALSSYFQQHGEVPIGPVFNNLTNVATVAVTSSDVGVPEALQ